MQDSHLREKKGIANTLTHLFLRFFALNFNLRPGLNKYLSSEYEWLNFTFGIKTENNSVQQALEFRDGRVRILKKYPENPEAQLVFVDENALKEAVTQPPNRLMIALMENRMVTLGNLGYLQLFNFYLSLLLKRIQIKKLKKETKKENRIYDMDTASKHSIDTRTLDQLKAEEIDPGVKWLSNPYLEDYHLNDFPRLRDFLDIHLKTIPEICHERPKLLTNWYRKNGFEYDKNGEPWVPELRQAQAFNFLMENKSPIIRHNDLIAGTTTTKEVGVVLYPDAHGTMVWGELMTIPYRPVNPYNISQRTMDVLHNKV